MNEKIYVKNSIKELRHLLDWVDEIPDKEVHNSGNYKCRRAWFQQWYGRLANLKTKGLLDLDLTKQYHEFNLKTNNGLITESDINKGNSLIINVIDSLETKLLDN